MENLRISKFHNKRRAFIILNTTRHCFYGKEFRNHADDILDMLKYSFNINEDHISLMINLSVNEIYERYMIETS
jgi:hypothetical protein